MKKHSYFGNRNNRCVACLQGKQHVIHRDALVLLRELRGALEFRYLGYTIRQRKMLHWNDPALVAYDKLCQEIEELLR